MIEKPLREILLADSELSSILGDRVRPVALAQTDALPFVTYQVTGSEPIDGLEEQSGFTTETFEVDVYAATYAQADSLSKLIKDRLHFYEGAHGSVTVEHIAFEGTANQTPPMELGQETPPAYRLTSDYKALIHEV